MQRYRLSCAVNIDYIIDSKQYQLQRLLPVYPRRKFRYSFRAEIQRSVRKVYWLTPGVSDDSGVSRILRRLPSSILNRVTTNIHLLIQFDVDDLSWNLDFNSFLSRLYRFMTVSIHVNSFTFSSTLCKINSGLL